MSGLAGADWKRREVSLSGEFSSFRVVKMILKCGVCCLLVWGGGCVIPTITLGFLLWKSVVLCPSVQ